jgi:hypothetical protein
VQRSEQRPELDRRGHRPEDPEGRGVVGAPEFVGGRLTATRFQGKDYVYLAGTTTAFRNLYDDGQFTLDESWDPGAIYEKGQTSGTADGGHERLGVLSTNASPAKRPLSVVAINQADANRQFFGATIRRLQGAEGVPEEHLSVGGVGGRGASADSDQHRLDGRAVLLREDAVSGEGGSDHRVEVSKEASRPTSGVSRPDHY